MPRKSSACPHVTTVGDNSWEDVERIRHEKVKCDTCSAPGPNLWLCLHSDCLNVGCGESAEDHSSSHTESSRHWLTLNMTTMRIWCYACEAEVFKDGNNPPLRMRDQAVPLTVPATPKKVATPTSATAAASTLQTTVTQEESDSEEEDDNIKPRGLTGLQNIGNTCYMNAAIQSLSNCPPLARFFLDCNSFIRTEKKPMLCKSYQKLMQDMWHKKRPSYVLPSSVAHGIKIVHPMFRGYTQQDSQEFLRCFMDQIHEELKKPEVLPVSQSDEDTDSGRDSIITSQSQESGTFHSHDIPFADETPSPSNEPQANRQSDTDYETCDSGMSSERSSVENATIGESGTGGSNLVINKDKLAHGRRRKVSEKNRANTEDQVDPVTRSDSLIESPNSEQNSVKDRKESANKAHQRASSHERPITIGGGDAGDVEFSDAVAEMEPLQGHRARTLSGRSRNSSESESIAGRNQSPGHGAKRVSDKKKKSVKYNSVVSDVFDGKLLSSVQCLTCERISTTKETFQDLSLPIPSKDHLHMIHASHSQGSPSQKGTCGEVNLNQGWFAWMFGWMKGWFWGPTITLHHCLAAFFSADELKGDNMYSCEKCKKLRNGMKFSKVLKLPEILCIHLKRFRHEFSFSSKIRSDVSFPLEGLDLSPYLHKDFKDKVTSYDLVGVICHHGTAGGGHYTAYALNAVNEEWYEFDDQYVTEVDQQTVENCEAYVLFYRKKNDQMLVHRQNVEQIISSCESSIMNFYVSKQWINKFNTFAEPGPISNNDFLCKHGGVPPHEWMHVSGLVVEMPQPVWEFMHEKFGGGPAVNHLYQCTTCLKELEKLKRRQKYEIDTFIQLNNEFQNEESPGTIYAISMAWFRDWENFVRARIDEPPGEIDNSRIAVTKNGVTMVKMSSDYGQLSAEMWKFLVDIYGGGPELVLKQNGGSSGGTSTASTQQQQQQQVPASTPADQTGGNQDGKDSDSSDK